MKFVDFGGEELKSLKIAAQFTYKGYIVSASTLMTPYASVAVFKDGGDMYDIVNDLGTVEDAIKYIDSVVDCVTALENA